ncbi:MAG: biosynthetic-type acetolactate synthase large subunit [Planctomycetaceae bacterium]|jgi:acetolactate synthase-1/2/3 large subunit|nr:biosynthetic-type acetolactate synthase large subunit [Planctomycetaceae bacterium]
MSEQLSGADILVQSLVNAGVTVTFSYPGGQAIPLHQAFTRFRDKLRVVLPRHEQGGGFAAQGYARATGKLGVCTATSGPGATNLVTAIADAKMDSIPILAITGQVPTSSIGSDAFQESPIVEMCRGITKHHYLVTDVNDLARIVKEAIYVATTGRPGPVLVDIPKNVQVAQCVPGFDTPMDLPGYGKRDDEKRRELSVANPPLSTIIDLLHKAKKPVLYVGGGVIAAGASAELSAFAEKTRIPVTTTMMGLSAFPRGHQLSLGMLGMHGTAYANHAVNECDLLLALGVRFDDRVTGNVATFAKNAKIVHIDIDPSEINKVKQADVAVVADVKAVLTALLAAVPNAPQTAAAAPDWHAQIAEWKRDFPLTYDRNSPYILPQFAVEELCRQTKDRETIIVTGVGQHQMWATQYYHYSKPRTWISSCGAGTMGFGLPAAMGAKVACPDQTVIDIDGDGSFLMNIQEMATCYCEKIPVKAVILNNQHLGMVVQWEDRFFKANRANTYLGPIDHPETFGKGTGIGPDVRYPDFAGIAKGFKWDALQVDRKEDLPKAIKAMLDNPGPFLLDITIPYQEHVLPMIPAGTSVAEMIYQ